MYVRLTKTVRDKGILVKPEEVVGKVDDPSKDWYYSPFIYGEDALEYFEEHKQSIKGYNGKVYTNTLYWDLDCKDDFNKVIDSAKNLIKFLSDLGYGDAIDVYFSGNKGLHVLLYSLNEFSPQQTAKVCQNIANEAGVSPEVFDSVVYNVNRIFRVPNTKHQDSGLYKIPLSLEDLDKGETHIRALAKNSRELYSFASDEVNAEELLEKWGKIELKVIELPNKAKENKELSEVLKDCPSDKRKCIFALEQGFFGPSKRENATIRLAAYYKGKGFTKEAVFDTIRDALIKRETRFDNLNPWKEEDITRNLEQVFSPTWNGGTYSCKSDDFLNQICGGCYAEDNNDEAAHVLSVNTLADVYITHGRSALKEYPEMGIKSLDSLVRLSPKRLSIVNGSNGSGKTTFIIQVMDNLNKQKIPHIIFSMDMADISIFEKLGSRLTGRRPREISDAFNIHYKDPEVMDEVIAALKKNYPYTLFDFTSAADTGHIEKTIRALQARDDETSNIRVAFLDYAGRVNGEKDSEYANATDISKRLNDVCKRTDVHMMVLSQIPREEGDVTRPLLTSRVSKGSGSWEEVAEFIINIWRPFGNGLTDYDNYMHIYVAKNREGMPRERVYWWDGAKGKIREISEAELNEYARKCASEDHKLRMPPDHFKKYDEDEYDSPRFKKDPIEPEEVTNETNDTKNTSTDSIRSSRFRK